MTKYLEPSSDIEIPIVKVTKAFEDIGEVCARVREQILEACRIPEEMLRERVRQMITFDPDSGIFYVTNR